jgi:hypothetical protein
LFSSHVEANIFDAPAHSLKDSNASLKVKTTKKGVGVQSLTNKTLKVEKRVGVPRWGLGKVISKSIIHMDLHKSNNKLVSAGLEHVWCTNEPHAYKDSQNSPRPKLGGSQHLPPYNILCAWPWGLHSNIILSRNSQVGNPKILKIETLAILGLLTSCANLRLK